jgi:hypothetical protein
LSKLRLETVGKSIKVTREALEKFKNAQERKGCRITNTTILILR